MMSPQEMTERVRVLAATVGGKAEVFVQCDNRGGASIAVYPFGLLGKGRFQVGAEKGQDWAALFDATAAKWDEVSGTYEANTVKNMALAIIRITAELGACSDAALRIDFDAGTIRRFGADAVAMADEMAGNGPFSIVETIGANANRVAA